MRFRHDAAPSPTPETATPANALVVERPPPGLARGKYPASAEAIVALGAALLLAATAFFYFRLRRFRP
jgi:predicted cobalt transporter CbtA